MTSNNFANIIKQTANKKRPVFKAEPEKTEDLTQKTNSEKKRVNKTDTMLGDDFLDNLETGEREKKVTKSYTLFPSEFEKLDKLIEAGVYRNAAEALGAILRAVNVDAIIERTKNK